MSLPGIYKRLIDDFNKPNNSFKKYIKLVIDIDKLFTSFDFNELSTFSLLVVVIKKMSERRWAEVGHNGCEIYRERAEKDRCWERRRSISPSLSRQWSRVAKCLSRDAENTLQKGTS